MCEFYHGLDSEQDVILTAATTCNSLWELVDDLFGPNSSWDAYWTVKDMLSSIQDFAIEHQTQLVESTVATFGIDDIRQDIPVRQLH